MGDVSDDPLQTIEWGIASLPIMGETVSGDSFIIKPIQDVVLIAVVDGLGHGYEAAKASKTATTTLDMHAHEPAMPLVRRCHEALKGTRGVVMSIAKLYSRNNTMVWLGVGNIEGLVLRGNGRSVISRERLLLRGGTLGYQLPPLKDAVIPFMQGDILIFVTDGIRSDFDSGIKLDDRPQQVADDIMARSNKGTDDSLVLVVRHK